MLCVPYALSKWLARASMRAVPVCLSRIVTTAGVMIASVKAQVLASSSKSRVARAAARFALTRLSERSACDSFSDCLGAGDGVAIGV